MAQASQLAGKRFGKLIVLNKTYLRLHRAVIWECICDCGGHTLVTSQVLIAGQTKSCGCLHPSYNKSRDHKNTTPRYHRGPGYRILKGKRVYPQEHYINAGHGI